MAFWTRLGMNGPAAAMTALLVVLIAVLLGGAAMFMRQFSEQPSEVTEQLAEEILETSDAEPVAENAPVIEAETVIVDAALSPDEPEQEAVEETPVAPEEVPITAPIIDVVRIDPKGSALLAGAGQLGSSVVVQIDGEDVFETPVDASGKFVALFDLTPSELPRLLSIATQTEDGERVASSASILISGVEMPFEVSTEQPAAALGGGQQPESEGARVPSEESTVAASTVDAPSLGTEPEIDQISPDVDVAALAPEQTAPAESLAAEPTVIVDDPDPIVRPVQDAPAVVIADEDGVRLLQPAPQPLAPGVPDDAPEPASNVVIDTISYDEVGQVTLSGRGNPNSFIRVYVDGRAVKTTETDEQGAWSTPLSDVEAGVYTLRIDELNDQGRVTSRIETPFQREEVSLAANASGSITVQPGFTLWAIARENFGSGDQFVRVYEANRDLIRDPDLIYPGQVFEIPDTQ